MIGPQAIMQRVPGLLTQLSQQLGVGGIYIQNRELFSAQLEPIAPERILETLGSTEIGAELSAGTFADFIVRLQAGDLDGLRSLTGQETQAPLGQAITARLQEPVTMVSTATDADTQLLAQFASAWEVAGLYIRGDSLLAIASHPVSIKQFMSSLKDSADTDALLSFLMLLGSGQLDGFSTYHEATAPKSVPPPAAPQVEEKSPPPPAPESEAPPAPTPTAPQAVLAPSGIPLKALGKIMPTIFAEAVIKALSGRHPDEGDRLWISSGYRAMSSDKETLTSDLRIGADIPEDRNGDQYIRLLIDYVYGQWVFRISDSRGSGKYRLMELILTRTLWPIIPDYSDPGTMQSAAVKASWETIRKLRDKRSPQVALTATAFPTSQFNTISTAQLQQATKQASGGRDPQEGEVLILTTGRGGLNNPGKDNESISGGLMISRLIPPERDDEKNVRIPIKFKNGGWQILMSHVKGTYAFDLMLRIASLTDWPLALDGSNPARLTATIKKLIPQIEAAIAGESP